MNWKNYLRSPLFLISPEFLATLSYSIYLIATLTPKSLYQSIMLENDLIFLNAPVFLLVTSSTLSFLLGSALAKFIPTIIINRAVITPRISVGFFIIIPVFVAASLSMASVVLLASQNPLLLTAWYTGQSEALKSTINFSHSFSGAVNIQIGVTWWAWYRITQSSIRGLKTGNTAKAAVILTTLQIIGTCIIEVSRYNLIPFLFGLIIIYIYHLKAKSLKVKMTDIVRLSILSAIFIFGFFSLFSYLRGAHNASSVITTIFGYGPASYNRLAALINGYMVLPYGASWYYLAPFLDQIPLMNDIAISHAVGFPSFTQALTSEFSAVQDAGLNRAYIWPTLFGYIYSSIGLFTPLYFFYLGTISGYIWKMYLRETTLGVFLYPWCAFAILFWVGSNIIMFRQSLLLLISGILTFVYEHLVYPRQLATLAPPSRPRRSACRPTPSCQHL